MQRPPKSDFPVHPTFIFKLQLDFFFAMITMVWKSSEVALLFKYLNLQTHEVSYFIKKSRKNTET